MGKNKPRKYPDKKQNNYSLVCPRYESCFGDVYCEGGDSGAAKVCKGNPHNCVKTQYHKMAAKR